MSSYLPPIEDLDKFNPIVFQDGDTEGITLGDADKRYVKKSGSIMTGSLSAPAVSVINTLTLAGTDVGTKLNEIDTNTGNIATNATNISINTGNISTNAGNIATNATNISNNTSLILTNATNISNNTGNISTNTGNISTNSTNIATNTTNISNNSSSISTNTGDITNLQTKTQYLSTSGSGSTTKSSFSSAQLELASNHASYMIIKSDENNDSASEGAHLQMFVDTTFQGELTTLGSGLILSSHSTGAVKSIFLRFIENGSITHNSIEFNQTNSIFDTNIIPKTDSTNTLGSATKYFSHAYVDNLSTPSFSDLNTTLTGISTNAGDISDLLTTTQYLSVSGNDLIIDTEVVRHENNSSVYLILNGDKDNNNASQGSYLTLYAHDVFNGYLGTIGTFLDLHSFSSGTVKPIKFTFEDSAGTHTSLSCDDVDIKFNVNIIPETDSTFNLGSSSLRFLKAYIDDIATSNHTSLDTDITNLEYKTGDITRPSANILSLGGTSFGDVVRINCQLNTPNITDVETEIFILGDALLAQIAKTEDLTNSSGNYELATNLFEITAGNSGDCVLRLRADQDNSDENDNAMIAFAQDGPGDRFQMELDSNNNVLKFVSLYTTSSNNDNFQFYTNTTSLKFEIGSQVELHADMKTHHIYPDSNSVRNLGSSSLRFLKAYIDDIETSNHTSIDTDITNLEYKTTDISRPGSNILSLGGTGISDFVEFNSQINTPNITDLEGNFLAFGITLTNNTSSISTNTSSITTLNTTTQNISVSGSNTNINGLLVCRGTGLGDTTIDWGLTNDNQNPAKFFPLIHLDTTARNCYIGVATESGSSDAGIAFGIDAGGGDDPDIICYMANDGNVYFRNQIYSGHCKPAIDNTYDLGSSTRRWDDVRATNGTIQTSDRKEKNSIETLDVLEMITFIKSLNPVKYKFNNKTRYHTGLIADEVKETMPWDSGLYIYDEDVDREGLRYIELIGPMISTIQHILKENEKLKSENDKIKNRLEIIEQLLGIE